MEVPVMGVTRRSLLLGGGAVVAACCAGGSGVAWLWQSTVIDTRDAVEFTNPLAIPPLAPSGHEGGRRVFDLRAEPGRHDFGEGPVRTWGFNGPYLGPTLRAARGEEVLVRIQNALPATTTVHWHGMHLPAAMDGGPHQPIAPGGTWSPTWRIDQPATMLWYHPHSHGETAEHVYRGLAGLFILDDPATGRSDLPHTYGVDDIPVVVQDKTFSRGELDFDGTLLGMGILGERIVVNGTLAPYLDVSTERVRLRLLNASNARIFDFALADDRPFALIGTDGGLLDRTVATDHIQLSPGERADIVVAVRPGERIALCSNPPALGTPLSRFYGGSDAFDVLQLRAAPTLAPRPEVPARLVDFERIDPASAAQRRTIRLTDQSINGRPMDMGRIDATVTRDTVELWRVSNADGKPHNLHIHDVQFQVVRVNGGAPPPHLSGWKDTVFVPASDEVELVMRFADYADPATPYMFHCHVLYHEDRGMMGQFVVVEPGHQAVAPMPTPHHHG
jgi:FtsP/CotA-like multicopper oxidase with cupredoxin domain